MPRLGEESVIGVKGILIKSEPRLGVGVSEKLTLGCQTPDGLRCWKLIFALIVAELADQWTILLHWRTVAMAWLRT